MAATGTPTPNIGLRCPVGTDPASVDDINYNSGVIDTKLGAVGSTSVQAQIDALNSNITKHSFANPSQWTELEYNVSFTATSDGYVRVRNDNSTTDIDVNINGYSALKAPKGAYLMCFVRKDTIIKKNTNSSETVHFIPLV